MQRGSSPWSRSLTVLAVVLGLVVLVSLTSGDRLAGSVPAQMIADVLAPLQNAAGRVATGAVRVAASMVELRELHAEVQDLRQEVERLHQLENEVELLRAENRRLESLLDFRDQHPQTFTVARVIGRNPDNWFGYVTINKGSRHGVRVGQVAVSGQGLVGKITRVGSLSSDVLLLTDSESGVGAMVRRSGDTGVVTGAGQIGSLDMSMFARDADVVAGDFIVTSGLGETYPAGLRIGTVTEVGWGEGGLVRISKIKPAVDFNRLYEIMILDRDEDEG